MRVWVCSLLWVPGWAYGIGHMGMGSRHAGTGIQGWIHSDQHVTACCRHGVGHWMEGHQVCKLVQAGFASARAPLSTLSFHLIS